MRLALLTTGGPDWAAEAVASSPFAGSTLLDRALVLARDFDPVPLLIAPRPLASGEPVETAWFAAPAENGARAAWADAAAALRAARGPVVTLALELPLVPRVWLDYLRRLAIVQWPGEARPAGGEPPAPAAVIPVVEGVAEPGAALFHPDALPWLEAALAGDWNGDGPPGGLPALLLAEPEWRELAGPHSFCRCRDAADLGRALALARERGDPGVGERLRRGRPIGTTGRGEAQDERDERVAAGSAGLTHLDAAGAPRMVDVGVKPITRRSATAGGTIVLGARAYRALVGGALPKGDALATAQLAAIQAVKRTWEAIPLCHPLPIDGVDVVWETDPDARALKVRVTVRTEARTGVEMEALHGAAVFLLTVYDMAKAVSREMTITGLQLLAKSGGQDDAARGISRGVGGKEPA